MEMSFVGQDDVLDAVSEAVLSAAEAAIGDRPPPIERITWLDAMNRFGVDKPDLRFGMELVDLAPIVGSESGFKVFDDALAAGGRVKAIVAPGMAGVTRREIDELTERARRFGAKGLVHLALEAGGDIKSPIAKFLADETQRAIIERTGAGEGDLILLVADTAAVTADVLGRLRVELGERLGLADPNVLAYVWINRFPMYQWDDELGRWDATHNPFSGVLPEDETLLVTASGDPARPSPDDPAGRARALQYDLALNGWELGGGSIRIHRRDLLERSFALQGQSTDGMREKFGAILDAFEFGAPPHGGIAIGIDRWAALFAHQVNIREVMAFPKTQSGTDPMLEAPSAPEAKQFEELGLRFVGLPPKP
jgi:aspartyl-tRNA synthetase